MLATGYTMDYYKKGADWILSKVDNRPEIAIVLGSCLGPMAEGIENPKVIDYKDIPNFPVSTVASHAGKMIFGTLNGVEVVCMSGRFHFYEGYSMEELATPVRVLKLMGVKKLVLTNAAGGVNESFTPGDIMLITDHIKLFGGSPMRGPNVEGFGPRFFDVSDMYTKTLQDAARRASQASGVPIREGVYMFYPGPQFETAAEIRATRILGGDAVGMSTVTEALTAKHCGMELLALSLITNLGTGMKKGSVADDVDGTAAEASGRFQKLMMEIVREL